MLEIVLWIGAGLAGWLHSVAFVSHLSMAALVLASLSALQGAFASREASGPCRHCGHC